MGSYEVTLWAYLRIGLVCLRRSAGVHRPPVTSPWRTQPRVGTCGGVARSVARPAPGASPSWGESRRWCGLDHGGLADSEGSSGPAPSRRPPGGPDNPIMGPGRWRGPSCDLCPPRRPAGRGTHFTHKRGCAASPSFFCLLSCTALQIPHNRQRALAPLMMLHQPCPKTHHHHRPKRSVRFHPGNGAPKIRRKRTGHSLPACELRTLHSKHISGARICGYGESVPRIAVEYGMQTSLRLRQRSS